MFSNIEAKLNNVIKSSKLNKTTEATNDTKNTTTNKKNTKTKDMNYCYQIKKEEEEILRLKQLLFCMN